MRERCRDEDEERVEGRVEGRVEDDKSGSKGDERGVKSLRRFINAVFIVDCCCCRVVVGVVVFIFFFPPLIPLAWLVCLHEQKIKKKVRAGCSVGNQGRGR